MLAVPEGKRKKQYSQSHRMFWKQAFKTALSVLILLALLMKVGAVPAPANILHVSLTAVALMIACIYITIPLRVIQWQMLLPSQKGISQFRVLQSLLLGYLGNSLLPAAGGDFLKAYHLSTFSATPFSTVFASVLLVRLQDIVIVLLIVLAASFLMTTLPAAASLTGDFHAAGLTAFGLVVLASFVVFICLRNRSLVQALENVADRFLPRFGHLIRRTLSRFSDGLDIAVRHRFRFAGAQLMALVCWALFITAPIPLLVDLGLPLNEAIICAVVLTGAVNLALLLPITPAGLGTYHVVCVLVLSLFAPDTPYDQRLAFAFVSHAVGAIGPALLGIPVLPLLLAYKGQIETTTNTQASSFPALAEEKESASNA